MSYRFDNCALDTEKRDLRRDGEPVPVGPLVFDLITFLIENRDRIVSKDDLLAGVWSGRIVSESTINSQINAARTAVGDNGEDQRLIRTFPRRGFRFVGTVAEVAQSEPAAPAQANPNPEPVAAVPAAPVAPKPTRRRLYAAVGAASAAAMAAAVVASVALWPRSVVPARAFDAAAVPLVLDSDRRSLADYNERPDHKAIAVSYRRLSVVHGERSAEAARQAAMSHCEANRASSRARCFLYAEGTAVVFKQAPAFDKSDLRVEPTSEPFTDAHLPFGGMRRSRRPRTVERFLNESDHRIFAVTSRGSLSFGGIASRAEAVRLATDVCLFEWSRACLILGVDGYATMSPPNSRKAIGIFLPSADATIPPSVRPQISALYRGADWRAVARGNNGWYPIAGASSEAVAVETALRACAAGDEHCRIYAIGNYLVSPE